MQPNPQARAQRLARWAGVSYLFLIIVGAPGMMMFPSLIVGGDAVATAANIAANEGTVRLAFAGYLLSTAGYLVVMALFYELLRRLEPAVALMMVLFGAAGCIISASSMLFANATLTIGSAWHVAALGPTATADLTLLLGELYGGLFNLAMIFFGLQCILTGWLFLRSALIPRPLSLLLMAGGLGYLVFLYPPLAKTAFPLHVLPGYLAELALTLWLLLKGVDTASAGRQESLATSA